MRINAKHICGNRYHVLQMLPDLESGGVERGTLELGRYLCAHGHRSMVISAAGRMVSQLEQEGSRHIDWKIGVKGPSTLCYFLPLRRLFFREKIDILHLRSRVPAWLGYLVWKTLPPDRRPRLVTTFHGFYSVNAYSAVMTRGERVIAISETVAEHIRKHYGGVDGRISVIYRGFDEAVFDPQKVSSRRIEQLKQTWGIAGLRGPLIVLPGRITPLKGHDVFLNSLARIADMSWSAICVGDTAENRSHADRLKQMVSQLGLADRVRFVGYCGDMPAALMMSDVVVSATSTRAEAFGRIAVEAQAMGRPVIASAHGGSLETVVDRQTGWLVRPREAESLAGALREALADKTLRERFGRAAQQWVRARFTTESMCARTLAVYEQLLTGAGPRNAPGRGDTGGFSPPPRQAESSPAGGEGARHSGSKNP